MEAVRSLAGRQHGVFSRTQLRGLGVSPEAIRHRLARQRLFRIHDGVYAFVPHKQLSRSGKWTAAVIACGPRAALSDESAGCLARFWEKETLGIEVTVPTEVCRRPSGMLVHRRSLLPNDTVIRDRIPVTSTNCTLVALAARFPADQIETAISRACFRQQTTPEGLLRYCATIGNRKGVAPMRKLLERHLFSMTDSELEQRFRPIAQAAGLPTRSPSTTSTATGSTSGFRPWALSSRPTALARTSTRSSRPRTASETRPTRPPASLSCASRTTKSATSPRTSRPSWREWAGRLDLNPRPLALAAAFVRP